MFQLNVQEMFAAVESGLQVGGRMLLEVTAVLVVGYLVLFTGSLLLAASRPTGRLRPHPDTGQSLGDATAAAFGGHAVAGAGH